MIKEAVIEDLMVVSKLAALLWQKHTLQELVDEFSEIIASQDAQIFIQYVEEVPVGFAQCQLRHDYVEGTRTSPVGYLEGIFIREAYQHKGYASALLGACEEWTREKGCKEFASDCELKNDQSLKFHLAMGFEEANRIICFKKEL